MTQDLEESLETLRQFYLSQDTAFLSEIRDEAYVLQFMADLCTLEQKNAGPIALVIRSAGGHTRGGLEIADFITHKLRCDVHATVQGHCDSAATFVLLACKNRTALPNATFVIHSSSVQIPVCIDHHHSETIKQIVSENKATSEKIIYFYMQKLGKTKKEILAILKRGDQMHDNNLQAQEAQEIGLITHIAC